MANGSVIRASANKTLVVVNSTASASLLLSDDDSISPVTCYLHLSIESLCVGGCGEGTSILFATNQSFLFSQTFLFLNLAVVELCDPLASSVNRQDWRTERRDSAWLWCTVSVWKRADSIHCIPVFSCLIQLETHFEKSALACHTDFPIIVLTHHLPNH